MARAVWMGDFLRAKFLLGEMEGVQNKKARLFQNGLSSSVNLST